MLRLSAGLSSFELGMECLVELIDVIVELSTVSIETPSLGLTLTQYATASQLSGPVIECDASQAALCVDGSLR